MKMQSSCLLLVALLVTFFDLRLATRLTYIKNQQILKSFEDTEPPEPEEESIDIDPKPSAPEEESMNIDPEPSAPEEKLLDPQPSAPEEDLLDPEPSAPEEEPMLNQFERNQFAYIQQLIENEFNFRYNFANINSIQKQARLQQITAIEKKLFDFLKSIQQKGKTTSIMSEVINLTRNLTVLRKYYENGSIRNGKYWNSEYNANSKKEPLSKELENLFSKKNIKLSKYIVLILGILLFSLPLMKHSGFMKMLLEKFQIFSPPKSTTVSVIRKSIKKNIPAQSSDESKPDYILLILILLCCTIGLVALGTWYYRSTVNKRKKLGMTTNPGSSTWNISSTGAKITSNSESSKQILPKNHNEKSPSKQQSNNSKATKEFQTKKN